MTSISADQVTTTQLNAAQSTMGTVQAQGITSGSVNASTIGGTGGSGTVITASMVIIGGFKITAQGDGLYVQTPEGFSTKIELIDFRKVPVPPESEEAVNGT